MKTKLIIGIVIFVCLLLAVLAGILLSQNGALDRQLAHTKMMAKKMETDVASLNKEKEALTQEKEKLQADAASYMAINSRVTQEKDKLREALDKSRKTLETKELRLDRMKAELSRMQKAVSAKKEGQDKDKSEAEIKQLKKKIAELDKRGVKDKATFYYNLGVAYTQAKHYGDAIAAYENSLKLDDSNAEAHYNLGLIYAKTQEEPNKAALHYRAYLKLKPNAPDREEVEALISNLK